MTTSRGVLSVAYGRNALTEVRQMIISLRGFHDWPVAVITDQEKIPGADFVINTLDRERAGWGARWAKLNQNLVVPWDTWLYLDADTRVLGDLSAGFEILDNGWDLAIVPSRHQDANWLWQASEVERKYTSRMPHLVLSLQGGVFFARYTWRVNQFFEAWRQEWTRFKTIDQGALLRAMQQDPLKIWLLGNPWNGGQLVEHKFGRAAER